ncbi:MAG TPA: dihydroxyacetone kinase phosphoryl donor subunit DhaM [Candidatus Limnocylindrales bacterium]|nr:dihydroxyacetone kinase phosphoryl donor subunit DhaM [Candidatus Limnocylindrales bacterium]
MVGLVLVAHSQRLLDGLAAMVVQAAPGIVVSTAGGAEGGSLGTSAPAVEASLRAVLAADGGDGVLCLLDLGSAAMALEIALEALAPEDRARVALTEAPLVEGAILAAVEAASGAPLALVRARAEEACREPKLPADLL